MGLARPEPGSLDDVIWDWSAPSSCPGEDELREQIGRHLGTWQRDGASRVVVRGRVDGREAPFAVTLSVTTPWGDTAREFEVQSCRDAAPAIAVIVAIALDPGATTSVPEPPPPQPPEPPALGEVGSTEPALATQAVGGGTDATPPELVPPTVRARGAPRSDASPAREARPRGLLQVSGGLSVAGPPGLGGFGSLFGGVQVRRLSFEVGGTYSSPRLSAPVAATEVRGRIQLVRGGPRVCFAPAVRRLEIPLCAGGEVGALVGRGVGVDVRATSARLWVDVVGTAGVRWWFGPRVAAVGHGRLIGVVFRPSFDVENLGVVYTVAPIAAEVGVGVAFRFSGSHRNSR